MHIWSVTPNSQKPSERLNAKPEFGFSWHFQLKLIHQKRKKDQLMKRSNEFRWKLVRHKLLSLSESLWVMRNWFDADKMPAALSCLKDHSWITYLVGRKEAEKCQGVHLLLDDVTRLTYGCTMHTAQWLVDQVPFLFCPYLFTFGWQCKTHL